MNAASSPSTRASGALLPGLATGDGYFLAPFIAEKLVGGIAQCKCGKQPDQCCCSQGSGSRVQLHHDGGRLCT